ncbi:hypothetical protein ACHRV1_17270 [Flavobacterium aquidurense]|uniref:hypothetical protein n=1 Tax=Flavobacterium aquidurense TaxID=362413 RepID=UPI0037578389
MECEEKYKGKITPQAAQKMLKDEGMNVSVDEAGEILKFLTDMATVVVRKFLSEERESY